jgi:putative DNA primase/helicase
MKSIAKKTGGTITTLYGDTQGSGCNINGLEKINHLQVAKEIVTDFGRENLVFVSSLNLFRQWNGQIWTELDDRAINKMIAEYLDGRTDRVTKNMIESITDLIRTEVYREDVVWDADTGVIPVQNGELTWHDDQWTLTPHIREHYRTTLIPAEYDVEARAPRFEKFFEEVFERDPDAIEKSILICEMIGYTLTTSCEYEKFILLIGSGANGKSVLLDVIRLLVGSKQVAAVQPEQMDNKFQRAHLFGKLANIVTEIKEGGEIADAALKSITSGELNTAEHKFKKPFDFQPFCTCWFGTNHMPHTRDFSDALLRRALIVEFNRVFHEQEQDKHLKKKLVDELPGILTLVLTAFAGVIKRGQFTIPESCLRAKEQWRLEADQVAQFLEECCERKPDARVTSADLYAAYQDWSDEAGIRKQLNRINFSKRVQRLGGKPGRKSKVRFFDGVKLA